MNATSLVMFAPMVGFLGAAAIIDARTRRLPNLLTLPLLIGGILQSFLPHHTVGPWQALSGMLIGIGLQLVPFALGALGGGDVKLMAALGAWMGIWGIISVFLVEKVVSLILVLSQAIRQGRAALLFRNTMVLALSAVHVRQLGVEHLRSTGKASRSIDRPLPYAVPLLVATLVVLCLATWARVS